MISGLWAQWVVGSRFFSSLSLSATPPACISLFLPLSLSLMNKYNLGKGTQRTVAALPACTRQSRSSRTTTRARIYQTGRDPCRNTHPPSKKKKNEVSNNEHKLSNKTTKSLLDRPIPKSDMREREASETRWNHLLPLPTRMPENRYNTSTILTEELLPKPNTAAACHAVTSCAYFFFNRATEI